MDDWQNISFIHCQKISLEKSLLEMHGPTTSSSGRRPPKFKIEIIQKFQNEVMKAVCNIPCYTPNRITNEII